MRQLAYRWGGRLVKAAIPLVLIAFGMLWPVVFAAARPGTPADPVVISDLYADSIDGAGDMTAVETITTQFYSTDRHGIFRYWDVANQNDSHARQKPDVTSILLDGQPVPYQMLWEDGKRFRVAKIGDPDRTLSDGTHVFELRYRVPGVLDPGGTGADRRFAQTVGAPGTSRSVFFWNVIAPSWNNRIDRADITVTLPGDVGGPVLGRLRCGPEVRHAAGRRRHCGGLGVGAAPAHPGDAARGGGRAHARAAEPAVALHLGPGPRAVGHHRAVGAGSDGGLRRRGRCCGSALVGALAGVPAAVRAPAGPGAGAAGVHPHRGGPEERSDRDAVLPRRAGPHRAATGQRQRVEHPRHRRAGQWAEVDPVSLAVGSALKLTAGSDFAAKKTAKSGEEAQQGQDRHGRGGPTWAIDSGLMVTRKKELWLRTANALAFLLMICGFFRWGFPTTMWALPFAVFFLFSRLLAGRRRHPAHPGRARTVVARRRIPSHAGHRFGRGPVRLRSTQGPLHRLRPVRRRRGSRRLGRRSTSDHVRCTATGLVSPSSTSSGVGSRRRRGRPELRQFRIGTVLVDRRLHRLSVVVIQRWRRCGSAAGAVAAAAEGRRRIMVTFLLVVVLVLALAGADRYCDRLQQDPLRRCPRRRGVVGHRRRTDPAGVADPQPRADGADVRRPREGHPRPRHRRQGGADVGDRRQSVAERRAAEKQLDSALPRCWRSVRAIRS